MLVARSAFFRALMASAFALALVSPVAAEEAFKPDDSVAFSLSAEDWATTKTAHVVLTVEASVTPASAGSTREAMAKAIGDVAKADWRVTSFNRGQDQTGLEHWSVAYDARLPESALSNMADIAKKASRPGMQIVVSEIDFSPTLDETEAVRGAVRVKLYKAANDQLAALNGALPGRAYRIAHIRFDGATPFLPHPMPMLAMARASNAGGPAADAAPEEPMQRAEKITLTAQVVLAASPQPAAGAH